MILIWHKHSLCSSPSPLSTSENSAKSSRAGMVNVLLCKINLITLYKTYYRIRSNSWQMGVPAGWILQVSPEGGIARIASCNSTASPIPASFKAWVQKQYLFLVQASHSIRDLGAFCPLVGVLSSHLQYISRHHIFLVWLQPKRMLELEKSTIFGSPGGTVTAREL